mmetsp:Transcript_28017/g.47960  ORF Transcript_28017/g.47960 Transcript_28017/m.47960 type:complete len:234 (+) Transcript_28017:318-1019(+)
MNHESSLMAILTARSNGLIHTVHSKQSSTAVVVHLVPSALLAGGGFGLVAADVVTEGVDHETVAVQVHLVAALGDSLGDLLRRLNTTKLQESRVVLDGISDKLGGLGLSLGSDDNRLLLLQGTLHNVLGTLTVLLGHLLGLHRRCVLLREGQVGDGHIVQLDLEVKRALQEQVAHLLADLVTLGQKLGSVVLRHHGLGHLVHDGRQHTDIVISAESSVDKSEVLSIRLEQNSQ